MNTYCESLALQVAVPENTDQWYSTLDKFQKLLDILAQQRCTAISKEGFYCPLKAQNV